MVVKIFSDATCLCLQNNQHRFTHPGFFSPFLPLVSFVHHSNKINSLFLQMMLPKLTHQWRRLGAKICSILLYSSFMSGCKLAVTPESSQFFFGPSTKNGIIRKCPGDLVCLRDNEPPSQRTEHTSSCIPVASLNDAESRVLSPAVC